MIHESSGGTSPLKKINMLTPVLTNSDLEAVKRELKGMLGDNTHGILK